MKCPDFETLMLFLDGELEGDELSEVAGHVDSCPECLRILKTQRRLEESWRDDFEYPGVKSSGENRSRFGTRGKET